ncbi:malate synthase G [Salibacterium aidingense]|uniref:malate synthase G n=1 Tax=Salibacterium aidingense TaxID=384933 RepID=UPI003BD4CFFE
MGKYMEAGHLQVAEELYTFVNKEVLPGTGVEKEYFWKELEALYFDFEPENKELLRKREAIQEQIHAWHQDNKRNFDFDKYKQFLQDIRYLEPEGDDFQITTEKVDEEIAGQPGPQLIVPVDNARYALNAANARWGSLYDALYGTDVIPEENGAEKTAEYNPKRGEKVIAWAKAFLDEIAPLQQGSHQDVVRYTVENGTLQAESGEGTKTGLSNPDRFSGFQGDNTSPSALLIQNNNLHVEVQIDEEHPIGKKDKAAVKDVVLEAAVTTIMDCEDAVAAVDAEDKVRVYRNWLGLMKGDLTTAFIKGANSVTRKLNPDRNYNTPDGGTLTLSGRSHMFIRNVGHLMTTPAVLDKNDKEMPEGILDGVLTSLIAKHDLLGNSPYVNSREQSIYIVKPKMHGAEETAFSNRLFERIEDMLELARNTLKIGVMDEERRTSLNLKACIREVKDRVVFINTGFLDRTGDEIHTSMEAGPMIRKGEMKRSTWLQAYEKSNVYKGLETGLKGRAQIGKGMWAMPELMANMLEQKAGQLKAGANTAWVPSPTAAVLHAIHYHQIDVKEVQNQLLHQSEELEDDILNVPTALNPDWTKEDIQEELDNNAQGILGYVVRWVEMGIGCSKVPDINNVALMEDRATLRIASQLLANWLYHGICSEEQLLDTMKRMAKIVDEQNQGAEGYVPMAENFDESTAFQAACDLVFKGYDQPSGYTEPILHQRRREAKQKMTAARR